MSNLFHKSMYARKDVPSYWEETVQPRSDLGKPLEGDAACDVAIIGGGYTGLSAAMNLAKDSNMKVAVLESGPMGWGASGRNGGFNCLPATKMSTKQMIKKYGEDETKKFWARQLDGVAYTAELEASEGIDYDRQGDGNLEVAHRPQEFDGLHDYAATLKKFGIDSKVMTKQEFAEVGYDSEEQFGALHMKAGFALNPLKFALGLAQAAEKYGATLYPYSHVDNWTKEGATHVLRTAKGALRAKKVLIATNGFYQDGLQKTMDKRILPVISNIITTRPLTDDELAAHNWQVEEPICNTRNLLFYFRKLKDNRLMLGARGDWTGRPDDAERMKQWMAERVYEVFPHWRGVEISHYWRGFVCMSMKLAPSMGYDRDDPSIYYSYGYHANGVNTAPWAGKMMAEIIAGKTTADEAIPVVMRGHTPRFPFASLRVWYLRAAAAWYKWNDD
ncbi:NAD(P)/FAD-dependent oxidoreductase [Curvivirga sp.]|uniref:NAD(P)/FAD-dependent oxidoreductase n=1 Tax=Curvivirga sp. TaxID=2856848 RepID=UPI003B59E733